MYKITNSGSGYYLIDNTNNPTLKLIRGFQYLFEINALGHPFLIKSVKETGVENNYNSGVENNGTSVGIIIFSVPSNAPSQLYYSCQFHSSMSGNILISDEGPTGPTGPIGAATPWTTITSTTNIYYASGTVGIGLTTPDVNYALDVSGVIKTLGINNVSDYRIKENVTPLSMSVGLPSIDTLRPVLYYNKLLQKHEYGFIAHEVQEIFPDLVVGAKDAEQYQTINYTPMFALLVNEVKQMKREISELRTQLHPNKGSE